jgi:hypothetical protein
LLLCAGAAVTQSRIASDKKRGLRGSREFFMADPSIAVDNEGFVDLIKKGGSFLGLQ